MKPIEFNDPSFDQKPYIEANHQLPHQSLGKAHVGSFQPLNEQVKNEGHPYPVSMGKDSYTIHFDSSKPSAPVSPAVKEHLQKLHNKFEEFFAQVEFNDLPHPLNKLLLHTKDAMELNLEFSALTKLGGAASKSANKLLNTSL